MDSGINILKGKLFLEFSGGGKGIIMHMSLYLVTLSWGQV